MFPKRARLTRATISAILAGGRRVTSEHFTVIVPNVSAPEHAGYAVIVPKRVARLSVARHRVKQQVSAILRLIHLPAQLIIILRSPIHSVSYVDMREELTRLTARIAR